MMKNLPIKEEFRLDTVVSGNFYITEKDVYVKVFSELYDREYHFSLGFIDKKEGIDAARYTARRYQDLVEIGFYPPGTQFLVAKDELDMVTVMAFMPKLDFPEWCPDLESRISKLREKASEVLGVSVGELSHDTILSENYGWLDGEVYCFDLHVLDFDRLLKDGKEYRDMSWI